MTCPDCKGEKVIRGFGCPGFRLVEIACRFCAATGNVGLEEMRRREAGEKHRQARLSEGLTLRQAAIRAGLDIVAYSDMERGMRPGEEKH